MSFTEWREAAMADTYQPLSESDLDEMFSWTARHGSGNGFTGSSGTSATYIRKLLREVAHLRMEVETMRSQPRQEPTANQVGVVVDYYNAHIEAIGLLRRLNDLLQDMQCPDGEAAYKSVNWSDVATLNEINRQLSELVEFAESALGK